MTVSGGPSVGSAMEIHRLLDAAFAGIDITPEVQDLKEEMRANLVVRVAEFEGSGMAPALAAQRAIAELGDIRSVVDEMETVWGTTPTHARHRVRPKPSYVVRTVVLSTVGAAALAPVVIPIFGVTIALAAQVASVAVIALIAGVLTADGLRQETTSNYPLPTGRAGGYGGAATLSVAGVGFGTLCLNGLALGWLVGAALAVVASIVAFTYLGSTQTNRHKPWVVRLRMSYEEAGDGFTEDPAAAARFGLYTATIWLIALAAFAVLSFTVGWAWSWLALVAGVVAMMITLARTLFAARAAS